MAEKLGKCICGEDYEDHQVIDGIRTYDGKHACAHYLRNMPIADEMLCSSSVFPEDLWRRS